MDNNGIDQRLEDQPLRPRSVHVIINPAAGTDQPILRTLYRVFKQHEIEWEAFVTQNAGDALRYARAAAEAGVDAVLACGGDGTVTEVASGLRGTGIPLAILPTGTANVMAVELGVPRLLEEAASLLAEGRNVLRRVDMGMINDQAFLLRIGAGMEAQIILNTPRDSKNRLGNLAYVLSGLNELGALEPVRYLLTLDGLRVEVEGLSLWIANSMNVGLPGIRLVQEADVSDGLLDAVLVRRADLPAMIAAASGALLNRPARAEPLLHWQAREIEVATDPPGPVPVEVDGEEFAPPPFTARVLPNAINIVCPLPPEAAPPA